MNAFLDTNILLDLLADRKPFSKHAIELFRYAEDGSVQLFTSPLSIMNAHYLLKKYVEEGALRTLLDGLLDCLTVLPIDVDVLNKALRSQHKDFEDAVQILCAHGISGNTVIVTRNLSDFKKSEIPVLAPDELCLKLNRSI